MRHYFRRPIVKGPGGKETYAGRGPLKKSRMEKVRTPRPSGVNGTCRWWRITRVTATARNPSSDGIFLWLRPLARLECSAAAPVELNAMTRWQQD